MINQEKRLNAVDTRARGRARSAGYGALVASLLAISPAWASERPDPPQADARAYATADAIAEASSDATADSSATSSSDNEVTINQNRESQGDYKVDFRNNPNVYSVPPGPTIPCYKTGGGGASGGGVGLSFGGGKVDPTCVEREEIRLAHVIGFAGVAAFRFCNLENNIAAFGSAEQCLRYEGQTRGEPTSGEFQLLLERTERIERELREKTELIVQRCQQVEERGDQLEGELLECLAK